jgi:hypothetical protein
MTVPVMTRLVGSEAPICASPACSTAMISTPEKLFTTEPRPPIRLVPPMTTAAIAASSIPVPAFGSADSRYAAPNTPPNPASSPDIAKTTSFTGRGSIPLRRTASSLVPIATT